MKASYFPSTVKRIIESKSQSAKEILIEGEVYLNKGISTKGEVKSAKEIWRLISTQMKLLT